MLNLSVNMVGHAFSLLGHVFNFYVNRVDHVFIMHEHVSHVFSLQGHTSCVQLMCEQDRSLGVQLNVNRVGHVFSLCEQGRSCVQLMY